MQSIRCVLSGWAGRLMECLAVLLSLGVMVSGASADPEPTPNGAGELRMKLAYQRDIYREPGMLGVRIKALPDGVVLVGEVHSQQASQLAEKSARGAFGGAEIRNRLRVETSPSHAPRSHSDPQLLSQIEATLEKNPRLDEVRRDLDIRVERSRARLSGELESPFLAEALVEELRSMPGLLAIDFADLHY